MNEQHNARLRQQYDLWKIAVQAYVDEMDNVMAGQASGGRLISAGASVEFAWDMLKTLQEEASEAEPAGGSTPNAGGDTDLYTPGPH
ncbi:hypothetical protein [Uliginosibacterium sp. H1]|uniref:hypothetical protein n=1 Tax=Uliginosibacterium sp. H1 TaxID=3114757 RepID=UPI002E18098E|nr:hypothetical protein [Uliginosibacterium sp. H1]